MTKRADPHKAAGRGRLVVLVDSGNFTTAPYPSLNVCAACGQSVKPQKTCQFLCPDCWRWHRIGYHLEALRQIFPNGRLET